MAKLELYGLRLNKQQSEVVREFVSRMDGFALVTLHKQGNTVELFTYQARVSRYSYDTFMKFDSKDFMIGYMKGANDALDNNIHFA